ncbi:hypothetical protein MD484_g2521, partial [Candolleomyces efflorescens]
MEAPLDAMDSSFQKPVAVGQSQAIQVLKEISYGSVAGMISKVFEHPFDLTKVRLQSQVLEGTVRFNGPIDCLTKTFRNEGFLGLYRGLPAPVFGAMAENASLFLAYEQFKSLIRKTILSPSSSSGSSSSDEPLPLRYNALAAGGAGAVTSFILTPIELVKCKMQVQMLVAPSVNAVGGAVKPPGPISVLLGVIRTTGLKGLWLGHTGTFIRETGGTAAWFGTKEYVAGLLLRRRLSRTSHPNSDSDSRTTTTTATTATSKDLLPWESAFSGACAGAAFNIALFPADTVKSAMQTEEELRKGTSTGAGVQPRSTFLGTFKKMYKAQGIRGLYAGCGVTVARSIPSSAIIFVTYDELKKMFG